MDETTPLPDPPSSKQRPLSPDGRFYWDGAAWQPVPWKPLYEPGAVDPPRERRRRLRRTAVVAGGLGLVVGGLVVLALMLVLAAFIATKTH